MKKSTVGKILGVSAVTGGIILGGSVIIPVFAGTTQQYRAPIMNIAKTFNLDPSKVNDAFNEGRKQAAEDRLTTLVKDGKLTEEQKKQIIIYEQAIIAKREALRTSDKTLEEMQQELEPLHKQLRDYIKDQHLEMIILPREMQMGRRGKEFPKNLPNRG